MKILLTGGTGVIGEGAIPSLLRDGHMIRLLSRGADEHVRQWPEGVAAVSADVTRPDQLRGVAEGCDVVVHISGIIEEEPPERTFEKINVEGTRNVVEEGTRAGVRRFIYLSSLGADRGTSDYHASKRRAEEIVQSFPGDWLILRPGSVYGPGDEVISSLLQMIRTLPAMPIVGGGDQRFQPIWYQDLGAAIAIAAGSLDISRQTLELAGTETTTMNDLLDRLSAITGKEPLRLPVPEFVASTVARVADALGAPFPVNDAKVTMLIEENIIREPSVNALTEVFQITPTPLDEGLRTLADAQPEQKPDDGFGALERKRFWADIVGSRLSAPELIALFRRECAEIMPIEFDVEPDTPKQVEQGITLTAALPVRGTIQMRVEEATDTRITFATLKGHPLAGIVQFSAAQSDDAVRFEVTVHARAADMLDWLAMQTVGGAMQNSNWNTVVERMVERSGGTARNGVESDQTTLDDSTAGQVERWIDDMVVHRKRQENMG